METAIVDEVYAQLRASTTGDLRFDEHLRNLKYVIDPAGRLVAPVMVAMLAAADTILYVPEYGEDVLEIGVTLEPFKESDDTGPGPDGSAISGGTLADRWRIHHGDPPDVNWAIAHVDAARRGEQIVDGDGLLRPNPLAADEPALCRVMNRERPGALRAICRHFAHANIEAPVMVAVDPLGLDVRGRFEIIRVPAPERMNDADAARRVLEAMASAAATGSIE